MPKCPHCDYENNVLSAFCPACGGAMQTAESAPVQENDPSANPLQASAPSAAPRFRPATLGMKWLKFLAMFVLPLNIINGILSLMDLPDAISQFLSPKVSALLTDPEKVIFFASVVLAVVQVPLLIFALWGLFKQKWSGVQALLANYLINAAYNAIIMAVLLTLPGASTYHPSNTLFAMTISMGITAAGMIAMFFINRVYFNKRRGFFLPEKQ